MGYLLSMKYTIFPSINSDYMVSKLGFEFDLEKGKFLREFSKEQEKRRRVVGCFFETPTSRARGVTPPTRGGASATAADHRHQVWWPETQHVSHMCRYCVFALFHTHHV